MKNKTGRSKNEIAKNTKNTILILKILHWHLSHNKTPVSFTQSSHLSGQGSQVCTITSLQITVSHLAHGCGI